VAKVKEGQEYGKEVEAEYMIFDKGKITPFPH
jgi:hypothetical protein